MLTDGQLAAWLLRWDPARPRRNTAKPRDAHGARSTYQ